MTRKYNITWYPTKEDKSNARHTTVVLSRPSGKTDRDAKAALNIFTARFGNLKKNTIVKIIEMDENGQIGEDIIPTDNAIVPVGR